MASFKRLGDDLDSNFRLDYNENIDLIEKDVNQSLLDSSYAKGKAEEALTKSEQTQNELDQAILSGDSSPLAGQLSVGYGNQNYLSAQDRLIKEYESVQAKDTELETTITQNRQDFDNYKTSTDAQLADIANSIINYGGNPDGVTANDAALTTAKEKGNIFFPQNSIGNAVYYFTSSPNLDGLILKADKGVKLSFPTTNFISFKNAIFADEIEIVSRDRNNTGKQLKTDTSKLIFQSLGDIDDYGITKYKNIIQSELTFTRRVTNGLTAIDLSASVFYNNGKIYFDKTKLDYGTSRLNCVEVSPTIGDLYTGVFNIETTITSAYRAGIIVSSADNTFKLFSTDINKQYWIGVNNGTWTDTDLGDAPSGAYALYNNASLMVSFRMIDADNVEIYVNGAYITTINQVGISKIGFCYNSQSNLDLMFIQDIMKTTVKKMSYGNDLKISVFGDSITFGEGANISWADFLPQLLEGKRGIAQVNVTNNAVSGNKSGDQLTVMNGKDLTSFDVVLVMVGTNDIQQNVPLSTFETNITSMINKIKSDGAIPIFGIPPMFTTPAETGYGFSTSNYFKGAVYRSTIMRVCAANGVLIADVQSELGKIGADNVQLRDNIHPETFGQVMISKCFAKSVLKSINAEI